MKPQAIVRAADEGMRLSVAGDVYRFLARGADTDGAFALLEVLVLPGGGPPPHTHSREDELFYVAQGAVTFFVAEQRRIAPAGGLVYAPRGVRHTFRNESGQPARMLVQLLPAGFEQFLCEVGLPVADPLHPPAPTVGHLEQILSAAARYGIEIHT